MRTWTGRRPVLLGAVLGLTLLGGVTACGDDPAPTVGSDGGTSNGGATPSGDRAEPGAPAGGTGSLSITADGRKYRFVTDDCSTIEVPTKLFSLSTEDASIEMSLPFAPGPFDQDSDGATVPLTLGGADETYQTVAFTGERSESGDRTSGSLKGTAKHAITGSEVDFSLDFECPLTRG
ncbi:hypothetical protein [Plantactinospora sp. B5E13]|uniref:hypothetical protein n=1 Tax=unclassified Plantactinospora TaxID=2631981 RepID=UPI00325D896B